MTDKTRARVKAGLAIAFLIWLVTYKCPEKATGCFVVNFWCEPMLDNTYPVESAELGGCLFLSLCERRDDGKVVDSNQRRESEDSGNARPAATMPQDARKVTLLREVCPLFAPMHLPQGGGEKGRWGRGFHFPLRNPRRMSTFSRSAPARAQR
jgi:hypothetical protein